MGEFLSAAESRGSAGLGERSDTSRGEHNSNELRTHRPAPRMLEFPFASLDAPGDRSEALLPGLAYANIARMNIFCPLDPFPIVPPLGEGPTSKRVLG
jgi:hypothetical protein